MVRLINILKKNARKPEPEGEPLSSTGLPSFSANESGATRKEASFRHKPTRTNDAPEVAKTRDDLKEVYILLQSAARLAFDQVLHKEKIEEAISKVIDAFQAERYNDLMLMAYSFSRHSYLSAHIANDVILTIGFARSLGFERNDLMGLGISAFFHDLGMSGFEGISKKGQQLSQQEIEDIKQHPLRSAEIVRPIYSEKIAAVVMDVHERENGQGYPRGLPGAQIHLWAKIIAVVDTYEALTHPRIFRPAYSPYEAMKMIIKKKDILFDDLVVKRFIDFMSIYPVGSLVNLNSGEVAIVIGSNFGSPTRPLVRVIINENKEIEEAGAVINLLEREFIYITGVLEADKEKELLYFLKPRGQVDLDEV